jgi:replication factor A2
VSNAYYLSNSAADSCALQKNEAQHSLRPVTVGQLRKATQAHTDAEWMIENDEIGQVLDSCAIIDHFSFLK